MSEPHRQGNVVAVFQEGIKEQPDKGWDYFWALHPTVRPWGSYFCKQAVPNSALEWPRHPWHAEKEPCTSEIHSSSHQQSIPWELGGTGRAKPVPHPTSDQLLSPTLCCTATPCCPHETTGTLSGCTFLASQYSLLTQPASLSCLYHSLSCFSSPLPSQHPATIPHPSLPAHLSWGACSQY